MVLLRGSRDRVISLKDCGLPLHLRFTFFDQVHTCGMDIKQAPTAVAAITVSKDTVFRDYAQGAYRMRGIATGQGIELLLTPEVLGLIQKALGAACPETVDPSLTKVPPGIAPKGVRTFTVRKGVTHKVGIDPSITFGAKGADANGFMIQVPIVGQHHAGVTIYKAGKRIPMNFVVTGTDGKELEKGKMNYG